MSCKQEPEELREFEEFMAFGVRGHAAIKALLDEIRCPACKCATQEEAEAAECGCDSPVCERDAGKTLAEHYTDACAAIKAGSDSRNRLILEAVELWSALAPFAEWGKALEKLEPSTHVLCFDSKYGKPLTVKHLRYALAVYEKQRAAREQRIRAALPAPAAEQAVRKEG